jgi:hypothetical protein
MTNKLKVIMIDADGVDSKGLPRYDLRAYEDKLLVHQMRFVDPEFAEFYAENYMLNVWDCTPFPALETMH